MVLVGSGGPYFLEANSLDRSIKSPDSFFDSFNRTGKLVFGFDVVIMDKAATPTKHHYGVVQEIKGGMR